ncbi:MAG TPA: FAD-dependent oxidoreductase [Streptosporangiaceae bacterium]|jgi:choline dehydrogenase-like flavoprotein
MPGSVDVAVIGAGLAGLIAARDVAAAGLGVTVLEARDRVGGRLLNAALPGADGEIVEAGGQWVGPGQDLVLGLIRELGLDTFPTYDTGDKIAELRGGRTQYSGRIPRLNPAPRPPPAGPGTWTARCSPGSGPPARSSRPWPRPRVPDQPVVRLRPRNSAMTSSPRRTVTS